MRLLLFFIIIFTFIIPVSAVVNIDQEYVDSYQLDVADETYNLISNTTANDTAFVIAAHNITFDGNGYYITYSNITTGYCFDGSLGYDDITIINTNIQRTNASVTPGTGVYLRNSDNGNISNNTIQSSGDGMYLRDCSNLLVSNNTVDTSTNFANGLYLRGVSNSEFHNNTLSSTGSSAYGIYYLSVSSTTFQNGDSNSYLMRASTNSNTFINTNISSSKTIIFYDNISSFNYSLAGNVFVSTKSSSADKDLLRDIITWNSTSIKYNDTINGDLTLTYNITGLNISTYYTVINASTERTIQTDANGELVFEAVFESGVETAIQIDISSIVPPNITSTSPTTPNSTYENTLITFNATADQVGNWTWYVNIVQVQTNISVSTAEYTNSTLATGTVHNVTVVINNTNGSDSHKWDITKLLNTFEVNVTYWNPDSGGLVETINVTNITAGLQSINFLLNDTNSGWLYTVTHSNGTYVDSATATYENESLNFSIPLIEDSYNITESIAQSTIVIPINSYGMFNNWTAATNFSNITANESNDVCYTYYNVTNGEWESHYPPYSWNSNYVIPLEASVFMFVDAETTVTATIVTPSNTELYPGWNHLFVEGTDNETIANIIADIGANCTDVWKFNSTAGAYSNTSSDTIQPCQGFIGYITQNMTWTRSDL